MARIEARCCSAIAERGGGSPVALFTAGGGAVNGTSTLIRERVLGAPVQTARHSEAAFGVARLLIGATALRST